ncbi:MAG: hypothetical protein D6732_14955, partial [Methanobacteriota archaeon]
IVIQRDAFPDPSRKSVHGSSDAGLNSLEKAPLRGQVTPKSRFGMFLGAHRLYDRDRITA